ncbi:775_t:CDS:2 [Diversispora eburnea]|uniref:775_t:CDS:1 n=1 Tax=Diversispora eburnea TaxID=1213867 RepID=A0A9N9FT37_9GLOM|nr:775_t:CDS:2 [Diversispora eburnea]
MISNYQNDAYKGFLFGVAVMVFLHNTFVSFFLYKTRQSNVSNINKIIINISGTILFIIRIVGSFAPVWVDLIGCKVINSLSYISSFFFREALAFFLLWRLRQIGNHQIDKWASIILFSGRTLSHFTAFGFARISLLPTPLRNWCASNFNLIFKSETISICVDFSIDLYVTFRLIQILRSSSNNLAGFNTSTRGNTKHNLFTGVIYWNFVRLGVAFLLNLSAFVVLLTATKPLNYDQFAPIFFFNTLAFVLMSYVVTVDAEIVKVINNQNKKGSGRPKYKEKSSSTNATNKSAVSESFPKHNNLNSYNNIQTYDVSFKRLSFFEWSNTIIGYGHEENRIQEEFEEIIEVPLEDINHDLEKGDDTIDI